MVGGKLAVMWGVVSKARAQRNGNNGHAGGGQAAKLALFDTTTLAMIDQPLDMVAPYGRHPGMFAMKYGPTEQPAFAVLGGSSTGEAAGKQIIYPLTAEGKLGVKDYGKMYTISKFSDVANLSSRGNNNPNNQAKGFINGKGLLRNPGFGVANGFMPEVKSFTLSTVAGYGDDAAKVRGLKLSLWLSLVPSTWKDIPTVPGQPTDKPGTGPDGNGPLPKQDTTSPTNTDGNGTTDQGDDNVVDGPDLEGPGGRDPRLTGNAGGCSASGQGGATGFGGALLLGLGAAALIRRRRTEEK
jgi:MYXO-CTERM domain-containing protein